MKIKKYLSAFLICGIIASTLQLPVMAAIGTPTVSQNFDAEQSGDVDLDTEPLDMISEYGTLGDKTTVSVVEKAPFRLGKSLKLSATDFDNAGIILKAPEGVEYPATESYYLTASVYIPRMSADVVLDAGFEFGAEESFETKKGAQYLGRDGKQYRNTSSYNGVFKQNAWNSIVAMVSYEDNKLRVYVNGYILIPAFNSGFTPVGENTKIKDLYMRFSFVDFVTPNGEPDDKYIIIDDVAFGTGITRDHVLDLYDAADISSEEYDITETKIGPVPTNITVAGFKANITGDVDAVNIAQDGTVTEISDDALITNATHVYSQNAIGIAKSRELSWATMVELPDGSLIPIPSDDFEEGEYDSLAWSLTAPSGSDGSVLFKTEDGGVTEGDGTSPYEVGGMWHVAFANSDKEKANVTVANRLVDSDGFYRFFSEPSDPSLTVRLQQPLDEGKMTKGKYSVVEFSYLPNTNSVFSVPLRYTANGALTHSQDLFGTEKTDQIVFYSDNKIYMGGNLGTFDRSKAQLLGEYETGKRYDVAVVIEIPEDGETVNIHNVYINGKPALENDVELVPAKKPVTALVEVDLFMKCPDITAGYDLAVANIRAYSTDEYSNASAESGEDKLIKYNGKEYYLLNANEDKSEFYLLSKAHMGTGKFDSNPDRNHEILAKADFDLLDEYSIASKLNDAEDNSSAVSKLKAEFGKYLISHDWLGTQNAKVGLLSVDEIKEYQVGAPVAEDGFWWLIDKNQENDVYCVSNTNTKVIANRKAHGTMYIRPAFYVSRDFFTACKLDDIGSSAAKILDSAFTAEDLSIYDGTELERFFAKPTLNNFAPTGKALVGETLTVNYEWLSDYEDMSNTFRWYASATPNGDYSLLSATGKTLLITPDLAGRYIKSGIVPKSNQNINAEGDEVLSDVPTDCVYDAAMLNAMLEAVNNATTIAALEQVIVDNNDYIGIDLASEPGKAAVLTMMLGETIAKPEDVKTRFYACKALIELNAASEDDVLEALANPDLQLDLTQFNTLSDTDKTTIKGKIYNKGFTSYTDFKTQFVEDVMILQFSAADRDAMYSLLKTYDEKLAANLSELSDYDLRRVAARLPGAYTSFSLIDEAVTDAVDDVLSSGGDGGGGGSGSGSGSGASEPPSRQDDNGGTFASSYNDDYATILYKDVAPGFWGNEAIAALTSLGIINGNDRGEFLPENDIKREEFVKMIVIAFDIPFAGDINFADVPEGAWYKNYISRAAAAGIITGYSSGKFGVGDVITREDMAVILHRAAKNIIPSSSVDADLTGVSDYAKEAMSKLYGAKIVTGDGVSLDPKGNSTRAMAAQVLYKTLKLKGGAI